MATESSFEFLPYTTQAAQTIDACQVTSVQRVRGRRAQLFTAKPGDYIVKDEDDSLRVVPQAAFESEYQPA